MTAQAVCHTALVCRMAGVNGNISAHPLFVNPAAGDYHLQASSPSVEPGTNDAPDLPPTDLDGDPRVVGPRVDQGVDERQAGPPPPPTWTREVASRFAGTVSVGAGEHLCVSDARITGQVVVAAGGALTLSTVTVGDPSAGCAPNGLAGIARLSGNTGGTILAGNGVARSVAFDSNTGGPNVVSGNRVAIRLDCSGNQPRRPTPARSTPPGKDRPVWRALRLLSSLAVGDLPG